jgi:hypothetical protein
VRGTLTRFVSSTIPDTKAIVRTRPLEALVIGAHVCGLYRCDIESLARDARLGTISKTTVSGVCLAEVRLRPPGRPLRALPGARVSGAKG